MQAAAMVRTWCRSLGAHCWHGTAQTTIAAHSSETQTLNLQFIMPEYYLTNMYVYRVQQM